MAAKQKISSTPKNRFAFLENEDELLKREFKGIISRLDYYPLARFTLSDFKAIESVKKEVLEEGGTVSPKNIRTLEEIESRVRRPVK